MKTKKTYIIRYFRNGDPFGRGSEAGRYLPPYDSYYGLTNAVNALVDLARRYKEDYKEISLTSTRKMHRFSFDVHNYAIWSAVLDEQEIAVGSFRTHYHPQRSNYL